MWTGRKFDTYPGRAAEPVAGMQTSFSFPAPDIDADVIVQALPLVPAIPRPTTDPAHSRLQFYAKSLAKSDYTTDRPASC